MDYKDWVLLATISKERSLTKTAEHLFISQPALSYRLKKLEKDFGVKILHRFSNGVSFTPQGEYLLHYAQEMLQKLEEVQKYVSKMEVSIAGTVRLGVSSVVAKFTMAQLLKDFGEQFPAVKIILTTGSSTLQLPNMLQENQVDIVILRGNTDWKEGKHILGEEPMCIVSSKPIHTDQLPHTSWIHYVSSTITKTDELANDWWREVFHAPPPNIITVDSIEACLQMVSHGLGWCIVPSVHIANRRSLFSCPVTWPDGHITMRKTILLYRYESLSHPANKAFVDYILREYPETNKKNAHPGRRK